MLKKLCEKSQARLLTPNSGGAKNEIAFIPVPPELGVAWSWYELFMQSLKSVQNYALASLP